MAPSLKRRLGCIYCSGTGDRTPLTGAVLEEIIQSRVLAEMRRGVRSLRTMMVLAKVI